MPRSEDERRPDEPVPPWPVLDPAAHGLTFTRGREVAGNEQALTDLVAELRRTGREKLTIIPDPAFGREPAPGPADGRYVAAVVAAVRRIAAAAEPFRQALRRWAEALRSARPGSWAAGGRIVERPARPGEVRVKLSDGVGTLAEPGEAPSQAMNRLTGTAPNGAGDVPSWAVTPRGGLFQMRPAEYALYDPSPGIEAARQRMAARQWWEHQNGRRNRL